MNRKQIHQIFRKCHNRLQGGPNRSMTMKEKFQSMANALSGDEVGDYYGQSPYLQQFEKDLAALLGKESAVFMPSGTMAQLCALRIHCEHSSNFNIALHPTSHLEGAERGAYAHLHGMRRLQFGAPEGVRGRMLTVEDFQSLGTRPGAILLEIPYRPLGFTLPPWEDLKTISQWAKESRIPLHLDGARLWQAKPFYRREYAEIASLFDSVYVSFYKDLGGWCGAMLAGSHEFIQSARVWQRRHGGNLYSQDYSYVSAKIGLEHSLPKMETWVSQAKRAASMLDSFPSMRVHPNPPHTNAFQLYIEGDPKMLLTRHMELAKESGDFLFFWLDAASVPGFCKTEIQCMEFSATADIERLQGFVSTLLQEEPQTD
ncbi:MAG: beta-eliminating lyase-related protein [Myxococcota bacterium]|nr:beta-eliminating lyase-related protein [Myxococcota bacterium]